MRRSDLSLNDDDNLEGKVLIYTKFVNTSGAKIVLEWGKQVEIEESLFLAAYITIDAQDIIQKVGLDCTDAEDLLTKYAAATKKWHDENPGPNMYDLFDVYKFFAPKNSEEEILAYSSDILYVGEYANFDDCKRAIQAGELLYITQLREQIRRKQRDLTQEKYANFKGKSIKEYLLQKYVLPLVDARKSGNKEQLQKTSARCIAFCTHAPFAKDAVDLCRIIQHSGETQVYLIQAYVEKIEAIHTEQYERAKEIVDEIERIQKEATAS